MEIAFLSLRADASSLVEIAAGFDSVLTKLSYPRRMIDEARSAARRLLQNGGPPPCLQDLILAVNMVRSRRYLRIRDLMSFDNAALVSVSEFDCPDDVQDAIDARVAELSRKVEVLVRENEEILRLKAFVRRDHEGEIDYGPLATLYESDKARKRSWKKDESNAILLVSGIADRYLAMITPVLGLPPSTGGKAPGARASDAGGPHVVDKPLEYEVSRLSSAYAKIDKVLFYLPSLPWPRFQALRARSAQATKYEAESVALLVEAADIFFRIGSRLVELLRSREGLAAKEGDKPAEGLADGAELSLDDLALRQSMSLATTAAYLAALRLQEPNLGAALRNERQSTDERHSVFAEIERLADADTFLELREKSGFA